MTTIRTIALLCLFASGCTTDAGNPFAELRPTVLGRWAVPPDRQLPDGWVRLSSDHDLRLSRATLTLAAIDVVAAAAGALPFDPARPPPGYTLCHNGHCHDQKGRLVPYDQVGAETAAADAPVPVSLPGLTLDLLAGTAQAPGCRPGCDLGLTDLRVVRAPVTAVDFEGTVRDARTPARREGVWAWRWQAQFGAGPQLKGALSAPVDGREPPVIDLQVAFTLRPQMFDQLSWDSDQPLTPADADRVLQALTVTPLETTVRRSSF
jgi:hypothetical protein